MYKIKMGFKDDCACLQSKMFSQSVKCGTWGTLKNTPNKMRQVCVAFTKSGNVYKKSSFTFEIWNKQNIFFTYTGYCNTLEIFFPHT